MNLDDLKGKRVLITGASTGIGAGAAVAFAGQGADVAVHYNRSRAEAEDVAGKIRAKGVRAALVQGDLTKTAQAEAVVARAVDALGGLDILLNNAGGMVRRVSIADSDDAIFEAILDLNVRSMLSVTRAALPHLKAAGGGSIINVGSIAGRNGGRAGSALYAGAKAFVHSLTKSMAMEFAPDNIRANTLAPGLIVTPFHGDTPRERLEAVNVAAVLGRLGEVEDCVGTILFLASPAMSGFMTGQTIDVNGGRLMP